jgi:hypothetical protein
MFHGLAVAPYRSTLMQSYRFLSNAAGMGAVGRKQNKMLAAGDQALSQSEALTEAADELMSRKWVLGDHSLVLIAFADSRRAIAEVGNAAWRDLAACGLVATRMTHALQAAYLSMLLNIAGLGSSLPVDAYAVLNLVNGRSYGASGLPEISGVLSSLPGLTAGAYSANHVYTPTDASWASQELISNANSIAGEQGAARRGSRVVRPAIAAAACPGGEPRRSAAR